MAVETSTPYRRVVGTLIRGVGDGLLGTPSGIPLAGAKVVAEASIRSATSDHYIAFDPVEGITDNNAVLRNAITGEPGLLLVVTDDPSVGVVDWTWHITITAPTLSRPIEFNMPVPSGDGDLDLAGLDPIPGSDGQMLYVWRDAVAAAVAVAAVDAVDTEVLGRSLVSRGDRIAPTDDSAFTVSVGADAVAFQVDAAGNVHAGAAAILPSEGFEWAVGDRVAMRVDQAGNAHLGDMPVVPSAGLEFATGDGRVHFSWNPITSRVFIGSLEVGEWTNAPPIGAPVGLISFGDSMTYSQEGAGTTWPNELAALTGAPAMNYGRPAWGSGNIAMLAGASSPRVTVQGGQIPASGSVPVTVTPTDGWRKTGTGTLWLKVVLAGITGSLEYNLATESWAFVRDAPGDATPAPPGSPVRPTGVDWSAAQGYDFTVQIGRNNASETSAVLRDLAAFERLASRRGVRMLTLGVSPVRGDAADLTLVTALNAQIAANASAYFDVRGWFATSSPETATSVSYAAGHPQARFYAPDGVHFNALGYKTLARGLDLHMPTIGWA